MSRTRISLVVGAIVSVVVLGGFAARGHAAARTERPATSKTGAAGLIAFGDGEAVSVVSADGSSLAVNVSGNQRAFGPTWAPNGRKLAYSGPHGIWVVNADGTGRRRLDRVCLSFGCAQSDGLPVWSPNGRKIAWARGYPGDEGVAVQVVSANGSHRRTIAHTCAHRLELEDLPSWSPNGKWLVQAVACPAAPPGIRIVRVSSGRERRIWSGVAYDPVWSPDGKTIAFAAQSAGTTDLWTMRPNGTDLHQLSAAGDGVWVLTWSPDSRRIAYWSLQGGVMVVNADNTGAHTVLSTGYGRPAWSPDSKRLAVIQGQALYTVALNGQSLHQIATGNLDSEYSPPVWAP